MQGAGCIAVSLAALGANALSRDLGSVEWKDEIRYQTVLWLGDVIIVDPRVNCEVAGTGKDEPNTSPSAMLYRHRFNEFWHPCFESTYTTLDTTHLDTNRLC
jgi:hypothetical protein